MSGIVSCLNRDVQETNVSMLHWRWRAESTMPLRHQNQMPACEVSRYRVSLLRSFSRSVAGRLIMYLRRCATSQSITPTKAYGATGATSSASSISNGRDGLSQPNRHVRRGPDFHHTLQRSGPREGDLTVSFLIFSSRCVIILPSNHKGVRAWRNWTRTFAT